MEHNIALFFWGLKGSLFFDVFSFISGMIYIGITVLLFVIYAFIRLKKQALIFILVAGIAVGLSDTVCYRALKPLIKRPRPRVELNLNSNNKNEGSLSKKDYSMPSNHASNSFAFFIIYFLL